MCQRNTNVTDHRGVGQVPLQARYGQFGSKMAENGISYSKVSFGIFKINGIHFMRHSGRPYFFFFNMLLEIIHGNIGPHVPAQINANCVNAAKTMAQSSQMVVMFYLGGRE